MAAKSGFKNFLNKIGWDSGDDEEYGDVPARQSAEPARRTASSGYSRTAPRPASGRVVNMQQATGTDAVRMVVIEPKAYEDTAVIADQLMAGKPVIMNMENLTNNGLGLRILDFAMGASYALKGSIRRVSKGIFLVAPHGVDISGNITSSFSSNIRREDDAGERRR